MNRQSHFDENLTSAGVPCLRCRRRGAALLMALAGLAVVSLIGLGLLRAAAREHLQLRTEQRSLQAERLAEAALARATAQLQSSSAYQGETWHLTAEEVGGAPAAALIRVEEVANRPQQRRVIVQADYPDDSIHRVRRTSEAIVAVADSTTR